MFLLYVGVVVVENLVFRREQQALSCTSTGGPPTNVTWTKDGRPLEINGTIYEQTQIILDATKSTFISTLLIRPGLNQSRVVGNYSCFVSNSRVVSKSHRQHREFIIHGKYLD